MTLIIWGKFLAGGASVPVELIDGMWPVSSVSQMTDMKARNAHEVDVGEWETGESYILPDALPHCPTVFGTASTGGERPHAGISAKPLARKQAGAR